MPFRNPVVEWWWSHLHLHHLYISLCSSQIDGLWHRHTSYTRQCTVHSALLNPLTDTEQRFDPYWSPFSSISPPDCVLCLAHCGPRIHPLSCRGPLRRCVSVTVLRTWQTAQSHHPIHCVGLKVQSELQWPLSLQVSLLPVWKSNRHAVSGQCSLCFAAAAPVHGYDGPPERRPILGVYTFSHTTHIHIH